MARLSLEERLNRIEDKISEKSFRENKGLGNEVGYYVFDYAAGSISQGGGGGMAYFLAVEITLFAAQVINFFLQRNVTFKSKTGIVKAAAETIKK